MHLRHRHLYPSLRILIPFDPLQARLPPRRQRQQMAILILLLSRQRNLMVSPILLRQNPMAISHPTFHLLATMPLPYAQEPLQMSLFRTLPHDLKRKAASANFSLENRSTQITQVEMRNRMRICQRWWDRRVQVVSRAANLVSWRGRAEAGLGALGAAVREIAWCM